MSSRLGIRALAVAASVGAAVLVAHVVSAATTPPASLTQGSIGALGGSASGGGYGVGITGGGTNLGVSTSSKYSLQTGSRLVNCQATTTGSITVTTGHFLCVSGTVNGIAEVQNGATLWLDGGTITGNLTVDNGGTFLATGGGVQGSITGSGGSVSLQSTTVGAALTLTGGSLTDRDTSIGGNVVVGSLSWLAMSGGSLHGSLQVSGTTSTPPAKSADYLCAVTVVDNATVQSNPAPFEVGGGPDCATPLTVGGNLQVQYNGGALTIGPARNGQGNQVTGNILVQNNTGGGTIGGNSAGNSCQLASNNPAITPLPAGSNTATNKNSCNRAG